MLQFRPFRLGHLKYLVPADTQSDEYDFVVRSGYGDMLCNAYAYSAWADDMFCVAAGGIVFQSPGRGEAWYLFSPSAARHMRGIIGKSLDVLTHTNFRRVDMTVKVGNEAGDRLATMLGFEKEAVLEAWHPDGGDMTMYKRVKR